MKKFLWIILSCFCTINTVMGQTKVDTLYYDKNWKGCEKTFATYYRIYSQPNDNNLKKRFRDYYITGELQSEGEYISIDKYDDSKSVFDGELTSYYKSGKTEQKGTRINGKQEGEYIKYKENGLILIHANFKDGKLHGIYTEFSEDGDLCMQIEYKDGMPLYNYYTISNKDGYCSKVNLSNKQPIYETPSLNERQTVYENGEVWPYYNKNGIIISMTNNEVRDYGKYFQIPIVIANNSMFPFEFDPQKINAKLIDKKGKERILKVYSSEEYMKRVRRQQNWDIALTALGEGMSTASAGYSTSTTHSSYNSFSYNTGHTSAFGNRGYAFGNYSGTSSYFGSSSSTITTYDAAAAYQAKIIASERVASYSNSLLSDRAMKEEGYLKRTTIYPGERITGYVNIERKKGSSMTINININGAIYSFPWNISKKP